MVGVHTEYIPQTRNFVRVRADSTKSTILRNGIEYGPYSLKKAGKHSTSTTSKAGKKKGASKEIVEQEEAGSDSATSAAPSAVDTFAFEHDGTNYSFTQVDFNKHAELLWTRILNKRKHKNEAKRHGALQDCNSFLLFLSAAEKVGLKVDKYHCGNDPDQIKKVPKRSKAAAAKFGKLGDDSHDSTIVPGDTRPTAVSFPVSFDFWFYTGNIKHADLIKKLAQEEGVFEPGEHDAKVIDTTTTITSSTLCISSLLSTNADESEHAAATLLGASEGKVKFGTINPVDFSGFESTPNRCLITYIASQGSQTSQSTHEVEKADEDAADDGKGAAADPEADDPEGKETVVDDADEEADDKHAADTGADADSDPNTKEDPSSFLVSPSPSASSPPSASSLAPVYIFYTVQPEVSEGTNVSSDLSKKKKAENTNDGTKKLDTAYNAFKNGPKYSLRSYVPSVLAERVVLDAMMDLVARCVEDTPGYDVATRAIQTIMLSDVEYVVTNESATQLVPMEHEKPVKPIPPASASSASHDTGKASTKTPVPLTEVVDYGKADDGNPDDNSSFGNNYANDLKDKVKAALFVDKERGVLNERDSIVSSLYHISLSIGIEIISLTAFSKLTKDTLEIGKNGNINLEVTKHASSTRAHSDQSDELIMRAIVHGDYAMAVTEKPSGHAKSKYNTYIFVLRSPAEKFSTEHTKSLEEYLVKRNFSKTNVTQLVRNLVENSQSIIPLISANDNVYNVYTKIRAIRILLTGKDLEKETKQFLEDALVALKAGVNATVQQTKPAQQRQPKPPQPQAGHVGSSPGPSKSDKIVSDIQQLDKLFLQYELNPEYEWGIDNELNERLNGLSVPVGNYNWHGDRSLQRIVAQYAAFKVDDQFSTVPNKGKAFVLFSTGPPDKTYTTEQLIEMYNTVDTEKGKVNLHNKNKALYYACLFVTALRDQNFGALFTSQPNFSTKPVNDDKKGEPDYDKDYTIQRPNCGTGGGNSLIEDVDPDEKTVDLLELGKAVSLVTGLIESDVLIERKPPKQLLDCKATLEKLDGMLNAIKKDDIGKYTSGGAGESTGYTAMLGQSMKCFVLFLPLIESVVNKKHPSENHDFIRSKALSYGCVSHGLDPKHIIAVRYAMINDIQTYTKNSYTLSKEMCAQLFGLLDKKSTGTDSYQVTRELMRTRVLGAITVIEDVNSRPAKAKFGMRSFV
jgi:hypothetical protein